MAKKIPYQKYFGDKKALIISPSANLRVTLRGITRQLGVQSSNVLLAQNFDEAAKFITEHAPEVIISEFNIDDKSCIDIIDKQREQQPIRLKTLTCVISASELSSQASMVLDKEIDLHLVKPITAEAFETAVSKVIIHKLMPSTLLQNLEKIRILVKREQFDEALQIVEVSLAEKEHAKILYYKGMILSKRGDIVGALDCWEHGLDIEPTNYWCLKALYHHFVNEKLPLQNYKVILNLLDNHPLNPEWIPDITRTFIANEKYKKVIEYFDTFVNWDNLDEMDHEEDEIEAMHSTIAACMIVSANNIYKSDDKPMAVEALIKSVRLCQDKPKILSQIIISLVKMYEFEKAHKYLAHIEEKDYSDDLWGAEVHIEDLDEDTDPEELLRKCITLTEKGIKSEKLFEICIRRSLEFKRSMDRVNALVEDACAFFPDRAQFFKDLLLPPKSKAS